MGAIDNVRISGLDGIDVVHGDATTWPLPTDTSLVFIYNTFNPAMWSAFLDGPILDMGRPMQVLTVNMPQSLVGTDKVSVRIERTMRIGGRDFHLLEVAAITARTP